MYLDLKKELKAKWDNRIEEVKKGLDEEYGESHSYYPNYEGIFDRRRNYKDRDYVQ